MPTTDPKLTDRASPGHEPGPTAIAIPYLSLLRADIAAVSAALHSDALATPIVGCPGWTLADVGRHLGAVHRWGAVSITTAAPSERPSGPADAAAVPEWYAESARHLLEVLERTPPDAPAWHFGRKPRYAEFWFRRQALETAIHRRDAEGALGAPTPIDPALAADGVAEVVDVFFAGLLRGDRAADFAGALTLAAEDVPGAQVTFRGPSASDAHPGGPRDTDGEAAVIYGSAEALFLLVWGRADLSDPAFSVTGNGKVAQTFLTARLTP